MQFSLRILMAFVLLASLFISGWIAEKRVRQLSLQEILLRLQLQDTIDRVGDFELQKTLNDRFFKAEEKRAREYSTAEERFREIAAKYGNLEVVDESQLAIIAVPKWDLPGVARKAWRVFVPANSRVRLAVDFLKEPKDNLSYTNEDDKRVLEKAQLFEPEDPWSMVLPAGETLIGFQWDFTDSIPHLSLLCDDVEVQRFVFGDLQSGSSSSGDSFEYQVDRDPSQTVELLRFTPQVETADFRESFWLRLMPDELKVNQ